MTRGALRLFVILVALGTSQAMAGGVVSLDYCADQYALALAGRDRIQAVSPAATSEYSYLADEAEGLPLMRPTAEQVVFTAPELVIRQWGGGLGAPAFLEAAAIDVFAIDPVSDHDGVRETTLRLGAVLGEEEQAAALIADTERRLARIADVLPDQEQWPRALYLTPGGATAGSETFIDHILTSAGVRNAAAEDGVMYWGSVDLEALATDPPDLIVGAFFDLTSVQVNHWALARHSYLRDLMTDTPTVLIGARYVACTAWFYVDAVEQIFATAYPDLKLPRDISEARAP